MQIEEDEPRPDSDARKNEAIMAESSLRLAFADLQRQQRFIASVDLSGLAASQQLIAELPAFRAMQEVVAQSVAKSIDFRALQEVAQAALASTNLVKTVQLQAEMSRTLMRSIDFRSVARVSELVASSKMLHDIGRQNQELLTSVIEKFDWTAISRQFNSLVTKIDWVALKTRISDWLPNNLRDADDLALVAQLCLEEGLPLAWVPKSEIVRKLTLAESFEDRIQILDDQIIEVLDDCEDVLSEVSHAWATECSNAIEALRSNLVGPAQSHAANIIDSIVLAILGRDGRKTATEFAKRPLEDLPWDLALESLVLRPLSQGFTRWRPSGSSPIPKFFARHVTAHAVGQEDVFTTHNALIAIMLATSLTAQFWNDPFAPTIV